MCNVIPRSQFVFTVPFFFFFNQYKYSYSMQTPTELLVTFSLAILIYCSVVCNRLKVDSQ